MKERGSRREDREGQASILDLLSSILDSRESWPELILTAIWVRVLEFISWDWMNRSTHSSLRPISLADFMRAILRSCEPQSPWLSNTTWRLGRTPAPPT